MSSEANESQIEALPSSASDVGRSVVRDSEHYYLTGDCIFRVENTLFKIHKSHLIQNSPVLAKMFNLPLGEQSVEGASDDSPIVLAGDRACEFRYLLRYIYATVANGPTTSPVSDVVRSVVRDSEHYHPTGDCIIRIENALFKIHKFHLIHNSPVFAKMFELPPGEEPEEGSSDDLPIVLSGDRASDFRYLLKYIYAPVMKIQIDAIPRSAIPEIVAVAAFADKYDIGNWKQWALSFLARRIFDPAKRMTSPGRPDRQPPAATPLLDISAHSLEDLYVLYHHLGNYAEKNFVMRTWCERVEAKELPVSDPLNAAEATGDITARTDLYCILLRRMKEQPRLLEPIQFPVDNVLPFHFHRMFAGYTSLSITWERLRSECFPFPFVAESCTSSLEHTTKCVPRYERRWKEAILAAETRWPDPTNFCDRFQSILEFLSKSRVTGNWNCFLEFLTSSDGIKKPMGDFLLDKHFFPGAVRSRRRI
ncbi:hypothetical protein B0H11DRAFT_2198039 [Mycena galericulata]|nr:hypothetical protein B0H11DRAFT_2198039 [Mycena galericulata]